MRPVIWFLLLAALAVAITLLARFDAGYVVVVLPPWRLEMSFIMGVIVILVLFGLIYFGVRAARLALSLPTDVRAWQQRRRSGKADDRTSRAVAAYLAGQTAQARKLAAAALKNEHRPLAALVAAHSALAEGDREAAGAFLKELKTDVAELNSARKAVEAKLAEPGQVATP